jgi:hypothetical protein
MDLILHLRVAGLAVVAVGLAHAALPRVLGWRVELASVSLLTRQVAYVHSAYIGLTCVFLGAIPAFAPELLVTRSALATWLLTGLVGFWGSRLFVQVGVYDPELWHGNGARTAAHVAFLGLWTYETLAYAAGLVHQLG